MFQGVIKDLYPTMSDCCLVDVTYEATELAVIRHGALQYTTQTSIGLNTLVRNFANVLNIPHEEAYSLLHEPSYTNARERLSKSKLEAMDAILADYHAALTDLLKEAGDTLSIPHTIFVHGTTLGDAIIKPCVTAAGRASAGATPVVYEITAELLTNTYTPEEKTALQKVAPYPSMLLEARFFHKPQPWSSALEE